MVPLDLVNLTALMNISAGHSDVAIGLIDGPVALDHPDLAGVKMHTAHQTTCEREQSIACLHGTFVGGMLFARRGSPAPSICPDCTLLIRPVFTETVQGDVASPNAAPEDLAAAIIECIEAGARVLNLSLALIQSSRRAQFVLLEALDLAARRGVLVVAAAGNQGMVGGSVITSHPWVIPVVACDINGKPLQESNLGRSIGQRGLRAPGEKITSLSTAGKTMTLSGTSAAAPFVTGTLALLLSRFPTIGAAEFHSAFMHAHSRRSRSVTPPMLDAWAAYQFLNRTYSRRRAA